jgi:preprotein translocase subunit SecE
MAKANSNKKNSDDTSKRVDQAKKMAARQANQKKKKGSVKEYWKGVRTEMSKVIWPTKKELGAYTVVVIVTCAFFALGFWAIDSAWLAGLKALLGVTLS